MAKEKRVADLDDEISPIPPEGAGGGAGDDKPPPPYGTPKPAEKGDLPRVVSELVRAGDGQSRFKIVCRNYSPQPVKYILAKKDDEAGAAACYLKITRLDALTEKLKKNGASFEPPDLVITALKD